MITSKGKRSFQKLLILLIIGFVIIFAGVTILFATAIFYGGGSVNFGAVIFIGPFPIVVGAGPEAMWMILFAIVLTVLSVVMFLIMRKEMKKSNA